MTHDDCRRCAAAPHPDILTGLHANYVRLADQGLTIPALVTQGERLWAEHADDIRKRLDKAWTTADQPKEQP